MSSSNTDFYKKDIKPIALFSIVLLSLPLWFEYVGGYSGLDTKIVIWIIFAIGFDLLLGYMGFLSFGHAAFFGTSAYVTGLMLLHYSDNIIPAMLMGILAAIIMAFIIGFLTLKRTGIYFSILTLAFGEMLHSMVLSTLQDWTGGDNGLTGLPTPMLFDIKMQDDTMYYFTVIIAIVAYYIARRIIRSPFGLMLVAIKSNQVRLEYTGVHVARYKLAGFVISAVYAGLAGALMIVYEPYVASEFMGWHLSGQVVIMSVLGGVGTLVGPMIGASFMLYFENVLSVYLNEQWMLVLGVIFMLTVIFLPGGFMELGAKVKAKLVSSGFMELGAKVKAKLTGGR